MVVVAGLVIPCLGGAAKARWWFETFAVVLLSLASFRSLLFWLVLARLCIQ
jgi:hypothetical protein